MANRIRYEIIRYWSKEDHAFIAEVPELHDCAADGAMYRRRLSTPSWLCENGSRRRMNPEGDLGLRMRCNDARPQL